EVAVLLERGGVELGLGFLGCLLCCGLGLKEFDRRLGALHGLPVVGSLGFFQRFLGGSLSELALVVHGVGEQAFVATVFLDVLLNRSGCRFGLGSQFVHPGLVVGEVAGDDQSGREEVHLVLLRVLAAPDHKVGVLG